MEAVGELGDEAAEAALCEAAEAACEAALACWCAGAAEGRLGGGAFGRLALQGICYMFCDRLVNCIGLFRWNVLGDGWVIADMVFDQL